MNKLENFKHFAISDLARRAKRKAARLKFNREHRKDHRQTMLFIFSAIMVLIFFLLGLGAK